MAPAWADLKAKLVPVERLFAPSCEQQEIPEGSSKFYFFIDCLLTIDYKNNEKILIFDPSCQIVYDFIWFLYM